jgi:hypothetical protein
VSLHHGGCHWDGWVKQNCCTGWWKRLWGGRSLIEAATSQRLDGRSDRSPKPTHRHCHSHNSAADPSQDLNHSLRCLHKGLVYCFRLQGLLSCFHGLAGGCLALSRDTQSLAICFPSAASDSVIRHNVNVC